MFLPTSESNDSDTNISLNTTYSPQKIVNDFLLQREPVFRRLTEIRDKVWDDPRGDEHFKNQRERADKAKWGGALRFYKMMQEIGDELHASTKALSRPASCAAGDQMKILDLCMAPGGYTSSALNHNPGAVAFGITLPHDQGGHAVLLPSRRSTIEYLDITMLAAEFSDAPPPTSHPEHAAFLSTRPFLGLGFDLVFCDGQVLRTHERGEHRERYEARRLTVAQLIVALQRIRPGGTLVMLLHKPEAWHTAELLFRVGQFAEVRLFKPCRKHANRSSFYLVATGVQPEAKAAREAVAAWKRAWWQATFGGEEGVGKAAEKEDEGYVQTVLDLFGGKLIELARPAWEIQANSLERMGFGK